MNETQELPTIQPEPSGRHSLIEKPLPVPDRPIVKGRHRMQGRPSSGGVTMIPTAIAVGLILSSADTPPTVEGRFTTPEQLVDVQPSAPFVPVIPEPMPSTIDSLPSLKDTSHFNPEDTLP